MRSNAGVDCRRMCKVVKHARPICDSFVWVNLFLPSSKFVVNSMFHSMAKYVTLQNSCMVRQREVNHLLIFYLWMQWILFPLIFWKCRYLCHRVDIAYSLLNVDLLEDLAVRVTWITLKCWFRYGLSYLKAKGKKKNPSPTSDSNVEATSSGRKTEMHQMTSKIKQDEMQFISKYIKT